jgi:hypothetical protein
LVKQSFGRKQPLREPVWLRREADGILVAVTEPSQLLAKMQYYSVLRKGALFPAERITGVGLQNSNELQLVTAPNMIKCNTQPSSMIR